MELLLGSITLVIIFIQVRLLVNVWVKIKQYKSIFSKVDSYNIRMVAGDDSSCDFPLITMGNESHSIKDEICKSLNMYLKKNCGHSNDFNLMKDVVERYCNAEEDEINAQQTFPLYLGLMGTMLGIIVGVVTMDFGEGFSADSVKPLMDCVGIAMVASLAGVFCTTIISKKSQEATYCVERDKNNFYTWLQTVLLPTSSNDSEVFLHQLERNLTIFNESFKENVSRMNSALSHMAENTTEQQELVRVIQSINVMEFAKANQLVLTELQKCAKKIEPFGAYLERAPMVLAEISTLNKTITNNWERVCVEMEEFFHGKRMSVTHFIDNLDTKLCDAFGGLQENTKEFYQKQFVASTEQTSKLEQLVNDEKELYVKMMREQRERFEEHSRTMMQSVEEINKLSDAKVLLENLCQESEKQTQKIDEVTKNAKEAQSVLSQNEMDKLDEVKNLLEKLCLASEKQTEKLNTALSWVNNAKGFANLSLNTEQQTSFKIPKSIIFMLVAITTTMLGTFFVLFFVFFLKSFNPFLPLGICAFFIMIFVLYNSYETKVKNKKNNDVGKKNSKIEIEGKGQLADNVLEEKSILTLNKEKKIINERFEHEPAIGENKKKRT